MNSEDKGLKPKKGKPEFSPPTGDPEYIIDRLGPFIRFFDRERLRNRCRERLLQYIIIAAGALIPIVNVTGIIPPPLLNILSAVLGGIVVGSTGVLQFEKYHERWLLAKTVQTKLTNEYFYWKNAVDEYANPIDESASKDKPCNESGTKQNLVRLPVLVKNCEHIIMSEASEYVGLVMASDKTTSHTSGAQR
jgi:uncharacterized protein DUF4231